MSYRRGDTRATAGRLYDRLQMHFGGGNVFMDVASIHAGSDFAAVIESAANECDVILAIVGVDWLTAEDGAGNRRLDDNDDYVVREIETGLDRRIPVIPILVDGACPLRQDDLPERLARLANRQSVRLDNDTFDRDILVLLAELEEIFPAVARRERGEALGGDSAADKASGMFARVAGYDTAHGRPLKISVDRRSRFEFLSEFIGLGVLALGAFWFIAGWTESGVPGGSSASSVGGGAVALAGATALLIGRVRFRHRNTSARSGTAEDLRGVVQTLAGAVRAQWMHEARVRALGDPEPMPVRWRLAAADVMDHLHVISPFKPLKFAGRSDQMKSFSAAFRALRRRRLVITGDPGTGKTTLAVQLLLELLPDRNRCAEEPIPILFSIADWSPQSQRNIQAFLIRQLQATYPAIMEIYAEAAHDLVEQGWILPILDGFDEVDVGRRVEMLRAINKSLDPDCGIIVTCRRHEYRELLRATQLRLKGAAVIYPLPLAENDIVHFLRKSLPPAPSRMWSELLDSIDSKSLSNVSDMASTPFGLWLLRTVLMSDRFDPVTLLDSSMSSADLRHRLLGEVVPALLDQRQPYRRKRAMSADRPFLPARHRKVRDLERLLAVLAEQLSVTGGRDWSWWQLASTSRKYRGVAAVIASLLSGTFAAVLAGVLVSIVTVIGNVTSAGWLEGLHRTINLAGISALAVSVTTVLLVWPKVALRDAAWAVPVHAKPSFAGADSTAKQKIWGAITGGGAGLIGLFQGTGLRVASGLPGEALLYVPLACVSAAVLTGICMAISDLFRKKTIHVRAVSPISSYRVERRSVMIRSSLIAVIFGTGTSALIMAVGGGVALGISYGSATGLVLSGLFGVANSAYFDFVTVIIAQIACRRLPATAIRTLYMVEDCHRLGLLRAVGPIYQFRHWALQEHFSSSFGRDRLMDGLSRPLVPDLVARQRYSD